MHIPSPQKLPERLRPREPFITPEDLTRAASDPSYASRFVDLLISTGRMKAVCGEEPPLTPEQEAAARAIKGGPGGDEYTGPSRCALWPRHPRSHYAALRHLDPHTLWIKWRYPIGQLLILPDCDAVNDGQVCTHWLRHPGPHNYPGQGP
ncbi:hypothetical protein ACIBK8_30995 [Streptomyces sp. NPDC050161]|uniref:hypothetical protein n=1 Tax=Streptomyces sp. NPDC050161 TaxID=3365604 RepID=UPI0037BB3090